MEIRPLLQDDGYVKEAFLKVKMHCELISGNHYWYNVTKDMPCDHYVPNCLMYNKGVLTAFCFAINAPLKSPRYEHPTTDILAVRTVLAFPLSIQSGVSFRLEIHRPCARLLLHRSQLRKAEYHPHLFQR